MPTKCDELTIRKMLLLVLFFLFCQTNSVAWESKQNSRQGQQKGEVDTNLLPKAERIYWKKIRPEKKIWWVWIQPENNAYQ